MDVVVIGAGFAGLYALHRLRGDGLTVRVFESADDVGGVWYWNRYPGARCDVESVDYSYSFDDDLQQDWEWSEKYATQPEILRYMRHVADRFDLRRDIKFGTRVTDMVLDENTMRWEVRTDKGDRVSARFVVLGVVRCPTRTSRRSRAWIRSPVPSTTPVAGRTKTSTSPLSE